MLVHVTFNRQVFAAVLELDEFLKEEEEERRQKEKKVSRPFCETQPDTKKWTQNKQKQNKREQNTQTLNKETKNT